MKKLFLFSILLVFSCVFGSCQKLPTYPDSGPTDSIFLLNRYQITDWGLPNNQAFSPIAVAVDNNLGRLYVTNLSNEKVEVFDLNGNFLWDWATGFSNPHGIAVDSNGGVYVSDYNSNDVEKFNPNGAPISVWGVNGIVQGLFSGPQGLSLDGLGNLYVADYANNRVAKLDVNGHLFNSFGSLGTSGGKFFDLYDVAVNPSTGYIYTTELGTTNRVQIFDAGETYVGQFSTYGTAPTTGVFSGPAGLAIDKSGNILVSDSGNHSFHEFTSAGNFIMTWNAPGLTNGLAVDKDGYVYAAVQGVSIVIKYSPPTTYEIIPNPVHAGQNPVFIFNLVSPLNYTIDIKNLAQGTDVFNYSGQGITGNNQIIWNVGNVNNGVYLATFTSGNTKVQNTITISK